MSDSTVSTAAGDGFPMTPACRDRLRAELRHLREVERPKNVDEIERAREHGDLRENAEYHAAKERQGLLDARMRLVEHKIALAKVIDPATVTSDRVGFGARVSMLDLESEQESTYLLLGDEEADADRGRLSINSPIARALMGKRVGDEVEVKLPKGERTFEVTALVYAAVED